MMEKEKKMQFLDKKKSFVDRRFGGRVTLDGPTIEINIQIKII